MVMKQLEILAPIAGLAIPDLKRPMDWGGLVTTTGGAAGAATNSGTVIGISGEAGGDGSSIGGTGGRAPWLKTLAAGLDNAAGSTGGNPVAGYLYGGGGGGGFGGPGTRGGAAGAQGYVLIRY